MNYPTLFPAITALTAGPKPNDVSRSKLTHQQAYLEFLSVVLRRPSREVLAKAHSKTRVQLKTF